VGGKWMEGGWMANKLPHGGARVKLMTWLWVSGGWMIVGDLQ